MLLDLKFLSKCCSMFTHHPLLLNIVALCFLLASCCCSPGHHVSYISVALNIPTAAKRLRDAANSNDMDTGTGCFGMQMKRCEDRRDEELCFCSAKAPGGGCRPLCCRRQGKNCSSFLLLQW